MKNRERIYALGFFDGVHLGHQALLGECRRLAADVGCKTAAITFDSHPQSQFMQQPPKLLNSKEDRVELLHWYGVETVDVLPVTRAVMSTPWERFLEILVETGAAGFVCGDDFRFGRDGEGNGKMLRTFCRTHGMPCTVVPQQEMSGERICSTRIRCALENGQMQTANALLGHPHILSGVVKPGQQLGRTIGVPTANLYPSEELLCPAFGVYACQAIVEGKAYPAVTNVGRRPTVDGQNVSVEPWLLDFCGDLYGKRITLAFYAFLRPEKKFASIEELAVEIRKNANQTREFFEKNESFPLLLDKLML